MVVRILVMLGLIVLAGGFVFFAANVIWLGTKEFFKVYGPKVRTKTKSKTKDPFSPSSIATIASPTTIGATTSTTYFTKHTTNNKQGNNKYV